MKLKGKSAIVTGAGSGIGRATAMELAAEGARVACFDLNAEAAAQTAAQMSTDQGEAFGCDVSAVESVNDAVMAAKTKFGAADILINCAGILDGYAPITETDDDLWDRIIGVDLKGVFNMCRATLPDMVEKGAGAIVNISSIAGLVAGGGGAAYTSAKHGVIGLTRQTAYDYGKSGIRANAICPGAIETAMTTDILNSDDAAVMELVRSVPAGRHGQPEEIAKMAAFLASDDASFAHGAVFAVDGGWTVK